VNGAREVAVGSRQWVQNAGAGCLFGRAFTEEASQPVRWARQTGGAANGTFLNTAQSVDQGSFISRFPHPEKFGRDFVGFTSKFIVFGPKLIVFDLNVVVFTPKLFVFGPKLIVFIPKAIIFTSKQIIFDSKLDVFSSKLIVFGSKLIIFTPKLDVYGPKLITFSSKLAVFGPKLVNFAGNAAGFDVLPIIFRRPIGVLGAEDGATRAAAERLADPRRPSAALVERRVTRRAPSTAHPQPRRCQAQQQRRRGQGVEGPAQQSPHRAASGAGMIPPSLTSHP
jgi:hypothetical protein